MDRPLIIITGPTGVGKSDFAESLAMEGKGEIISCDSKAVYKDLKVGTGVSLNDPGIPYHLVSFMEIGNYYSVADFLSHSRRCVEHIRSMGKLPIISGGSMLYVERSIKGLDPSPKPDKRLREGLSSMIEDGDQDAVVEYIENFHLDIDIKYIMVNRRRALRLLEKMILPNDGEPLPPTDKNFRCIYLLRKKDEMRHRIEKRVDHMLENGLIEETREVLFRSRVNNLFLQEIPGYREVIKYLNDELDRDGLRDSIIDSHIKIYKQQLKWIPRLTCRVVELNGMFSVKDLRSMALQDSI